MTKRKPLAWSETPYGRWPSCADCLEAMTGGLVEACASVAIERGRPSGELLKDYLDAYHANRHRELED